MKFLFAYVLLFLALTVGQVWLAHERGATNIDGTTYALLDDDIVISHTYAHQLVEGRGLVLNEGDRVEGFSNPAWLLLAMVPSELAGVSIQHLGWFIWTLNAMLAALITILLLLLPSWMEGKGWRPTVAGGSMALLFATFGTHAFYSWAGYSVYLQGLLLLVITVTIRRGGWAFYGAMALYPLVHAMVLPIWGTLGLVRLFLTRKDGWRPVFLIAATALPLAFYVVFRLWYYGDILPNTYYLKSGGIADWDRGITYLVENGQWIAPTLLLVLFGMVKAWGMAWPLLVGTALYFIVLTKVGGDHFPGGRFILPVLPAYMVVAAVGLSRLARTRFTEYAVATIVAAQLLVSVYSHIDVWPRWMRSATAYHVEHIRLGEDIVERTKSLDDEVRVALFSLGYTSYVLKTAEGHVRYPVVDMLGKADLHIARTSPKQWRRVAHQKSDPDYVLTQRQPHFIECPVSPELLDDLDALHRHEHTEAGYTSELARQESFVSTFEHVGYDVSSFLYRRQADRVARAAP